MRAADHIVYTTSVLSSDPKMFGTLDGDRQGSVSGFVANRTENKSTQLIKIVTLPNILTSRTQSQ